MLHLDMGKYALFVWPAWGLSLAVVGGLTIQTLVNARKAARALARREEEAGARPAPGSGSAGPRINSVVSGSPQGRAPARESGAFPGGKGSGR
jgi:heme exporter protein D